MTDHAFQTVYLKTFIHGFEQKQTLLRDTVTTETESINGNTAVFLVADSGSASAVTRGTNGLLTYRADSNTQNSCTLYEWHDPVRKTNFNVLSSQGNQVEIMQATTMAVINRKIDEQIIDQLETLTNDTGAYATGSVELVMKAQTILTNNSVPWDSNITLLCSGALLSYLKQAPEFASAEYVNSKPLADGGANWRDAPGMYRWDNMAIIVHPNIPTNSGRTEEHCYLYHKNSLGHAVNKSAIATAVGYNEEQDYSYCRASVYMGSKLLQNAGGVDIKHNGSAYVAA